MVNDLEELPNKTNWVSLVRQLLMSLGFYDVWLAQSVGYIDAFLSVFKQRLNDTFMQNWRERIDDSSRANLYKTLTFFSFNQTWKISTFLNICKPLVNYVCPRID